MGYAKFELTQGFINKLGDGFLEFINECDEFEFSECRFLSTLTVPAPEDPIIKIVAEHDRFDGTLDEPENVILLYSEDDDTFEFFKENQITTIDIYDEEPSDSSD